MAAQLRSPWNFLLLAEDEGSKIVGFVHMLVKRKAGEAPTAFIRTLAQRGTHTPHLAHRLLSAVTKALSDGQTLQIKVHVPADDARLRTILEQMNFRLSSVEMTFKPKWK